MRSTAGPAAATPAPSSGPSPLVGSGGAVAGREGVPAGRAEPMALVRAFLASLERTLGAAGAGKAELLVHPRRLPSPEAAVAVCAGDRNPGWLDRAARRTGLRPSFRGRAGRVGPDAGGGPAGAGEAAAPGSLDGPGSPDVPGSLGVTVLDRWNPAALEPTPPGFDVLAVLATFNESDVIEGVLDGLRSQGVRAHVIDNWSTDGTYEALARRASADPGVTLERFPLHGPSPTFELEQILRRVEEVAHASGADWVVNQDADEVRQAPWDGVSLRRALYALDRFGFNCADFTVMNFRPVADTWDGTQPLTGAFTWFEFGAGVHADFVQRKAWKPQPEPVRFASTGGHDTAFSGRRIFPYKFLNRHYPIRSSAHGRRKVLQERRDRWSPTERAKGWHVHYDGFTDASDFLWRPQTLHRFGSLESLDQRLLVERLTGAGLPANPFPGEALGG